ncbi:MAG: sodium-dependent transporter [Crocinitomicaceae bacterium]|nr:sodium-dependent transporter [Crocinitomicaceae bacterium]
MSKRHSWPNQFIYILAAIGCAAGLGNFWRFPMLAYEYGGAAFILAMLLSNIVIVFPLMMLETSIGQKAQAGPPKSMEKLKKGTGWIQWLAPLTIIGVLIYYVPIMAWGITYLFDTFSGQFLEDPTNYFVTDILHLSADINETGTVQIAILIALVVSYILILLSLRKGIKSMSKVIKFTATAPFVILIILLIRAVTLPGASIGLNAFFVPDWSQLGNPELWQAAISQSFFSASLAMGYFIYAGGRRKETAEIPKTSLWILSGNFLVSILSGLVVFATLGFMAQEQGVDISEATTSGPMLVFTVLPTAISMMPSFAIPFAVLLFLAVITLAIDSIFGMFEIAVASFMDLKKKHENEFFTFKIILAVTFVLGIPITFNAGLYYLDIMDHFITGYMFMIVGFLECFVVAYLVGPNKMRLWINTTANGLRIGKWFNIVIYTLPLLLGSLLVFTFKNELADLYGDYPLWAIVCFGIVPLAIICITSAVLYRIMRTRAKVNDTQP